MSLLTNFQNVQNKINEAKEWTDIILAYSTNPISKSLRYSMSTYETFSNRQITTNIPQSDISSAYTIFFTMEPYSWSNYKGVFGWHNGSNQGLVGIQYNGGTIDWLNNGSASPVQLASYVSTTNKRYNLAFRFGDNKISCWLNGTKIVTNLAQNNINAYGGNIVIGRSYNGNDRYFDGKLGQIYIYDRALNDAEINYMNSIIPKFFEV